MRRMGVRKLGKHSAQTMENLVLVHNPSLLQKLLVSKPLGFAIYVTTAGTSYAHATQCTNHLFLTGLSTLSTSLSTNTTKN